MLLTEVNDVRFPGRLTCIGPRLVVARMRPHCRLVVAIFADKLADRPRHGLRNAALLAESRTRAHCRSDCSPHIAVERLTGCGATYATNGLGIAK